MKKMLPRKSASPRHFIAPYRWRLHPGAENTFIKGWSRITELLLSRGSSGSRLHRGSDGLWYGYAQWPGAQARADAFSIRSPDEAAKAKMKSAIAESFPEIILDPVSDYIVPLEHENV